MIDDDKPRRNVLFVSAAIVAYWWFDMPPLAIWQHVLSIAPESKLNPSKLWFAVLVFLAYHIHRYWVTAYPEGWGTLRGKVVGKRMALLRELAYSDLARYQRGEAFRMISLQKPPDLPKSVPCGGDQDSGPLPNRKDATILDIHPYHEGNDPWGPWNASLLITESPGGGPSRWGYLRVPDRERRRHDLRILLKVAPTEFLTEYGAPIVAAYSALWITGYRLSEAIAWWRWFPSMA